MITKEMDRFFKTKDGQEIGVRHLRFGDAVYRVDLFENMSSDRRYRRFHQPADNMHPGRIWREAETIAHLGASRQEGLLAFADLPNRPNAPVAAARYGCLGDGCAEAAGSVRGYM